jgi:hypothetical protein
MDPNHNHNLNPSKVFSISSKPTHTLYILANPPINSLVQNKPYAKPCHFQAQDVRHAKFDESRQAAQRTHLSLADIRHFSVMGQNQRVRDAQSLGDSVSTRVLPNKLASRFMSRIATQVGKLSDLEDLAQA